jgi:hypothetical protein
MLKAGHAIASYAWADIDSDAHVSTTDRLTRLHSRHLRLIPAEATVGWDTRLPMDAITITPALSTKAFPAGVDVIITSPLCWRNTSPGRTGEMGSHPMRTLWRSDALSCTSP